MTPDVITDIAAQIVSFIALILIVCSYFVSKKNYLLLQMLGMVGLLLSFLLKANFFATVGMVISIIRALTFFLYEKHGRRAPIILSFFFSALTVASYFIINVGRQGSAKPEDILYLISLICYAFTFRVRDRRLFLHVALIPTALGLVYTSVSFTTVFVLISYAFEFLANLVALIKFYIEEKKSARVAR